MNQISWYESNQFLFDTTGFPPMKGDLMVRTNQKGRFRVTEVTRVVTEVKTGSLISYVERYEVDVIFEDRG